MENDTAPSYALTPCGHRYHVDCIMQWYTACPSADGPRCPLCRGGHVVETGTDDMFGRMSVSVATRSARLRMLCQMQLPVLSDAVKHMKACRRTRARLDHEYHTWRTRTAEGLELQRLVAIAEQHEERVLDARIRQTQAEDVVLAAPVSTLVYRMTILPNDDENENDVVINASANV